jgi:fructokinase
MNDPRPIAVCFGEILWDFLPRGAFPGGAPANAAYHLRQFGLRAHLVSAVGRDLLGDELLRRLRHAGLPSNGLTRHLGLPTGYVLASLDAGGDATYEIATGVAWDQIATGEDTIAATHAARALVFGSLALRSTYNRASLERLLAVAPGDAERVFDVNLRPPHDDLPLVQGLARRATLVKVNETEAARLAGAEPGSGHEEEHARVIAAATGCGKVCVTAGARGAGFLVSDRWHWTPARPTQVRDTIGAGDAFLAGLLGALILRNASPPAALACACRLGEFVASSDGPTPPWPDSLRAELDAAIARPDRP